MTVALGDANALRLSKAAEAEIIDHRPLTVTNAIRELCEVPAVPVVIRDKKIWIRTDISGNAAKLFTALHLKIPPKILKIAQTSENVVAQMETCSASA